MAKARVTINPLYKGGAGGYTYYVRAGEQVLRQRKNNSNYGAEASRTLAQMYRRIRWGNIVNCFKALKAWQQKAYDSKSVGQSDYNIFVSLNINNASIGSTKAMNQAGSAIWEAFQVSRGSLPPIANGISASNTQFITDIKCSIQITQSTTVGQLSADILANNAQFVAGDNVAFVIFRNWTPQGGRFPYASTVYAEITLDAANTSLLHSIPVIGNRFVITSANVLGIGTSSAAVTDSNHEVGFVAIHARKNSSTLQVSSQQIVMIDTSFVSQYSGAEWDLFCIDSYGVTEEAPLEPSFPKASVSLITANGSAIASGAVLEGQQVIRVQGSFLSPPSFRFLMDGVEFTPLARGDGYVEFIITQVGSVQLFVGGSVYASFEVVGVTPPDIMTGNVNARQVVSASEDGGSHNLRLSDNYCINYPYLVSADYAAFKLFMGVTSGAVLNEDDFSGFNCELNSFYQPTGGLTFSFIVQPTDPAAVCYVTYKGFIVFVGNYS